MKITFITTVKNEEKTIKDFLDSLAGQSRHPDEVIIVDGGSTDNTVERIKNQEPRIKNIKIIKKLGNRSVGRNEAIKKSNNELIACADAGCILDTYWLEKIVEPFKDKNVDVVAGFYKPVANSVFEKCLSAYTCVMPDQLDKKNFFPSSRSVAFTKEAWKKAKGYPENLDTCEDLVFDKRLKETGAVFITQEKAVVYWPQRKNIFEAGRQFYGYAVGDGKARYWRRTTPFLFARYVVGGLLAGYILLSRNYFLLPISCFLVFLYLLWAIRKNYRYIKHPLAFMYLPLLQIVSDITTITGNIAGVLQSI